ncbi:hypothetical protein THAOC_02918, partial [Thalassiosira oceanica]
VEIEQTEQKGGPGEYSRRLQGRPLAQDDEEEALADGRFYAAVEPVAPTAHRGSLSSSRPPPAGRPTGGVAHSVTASMTKPRLSGVGFAKGTGKLGPAPTKIGRPMDTPISQPDSRQAGDESHLPIRVRFGLLVLRESDEEMMMAFKSFRLTSSSTSSFRTRAGAPLTSLWHCILGQIWGPIWALQLVRGASAKGGSIALQLLLEGPCQTTLRKMSGDPVNRGHGGDKRVGDQGSIELSHGGRNSSQEGGYFAAEFVAGQLEGDEWRPRR